VSKTDKLEDALVSTGFPYREVGDLDNYLHMLKNMTLNASGIRRPGAAASTSWVAAGRTDGFWESASRRGTWRPGALLVREAGGLIGDLKGAKTSFSSRESGRLELENLLRDAADAQKPQGVREPGATGW
jgi:myo-inositol-1(or 4)-monophosphatase